MHKAGAANVGHASQRLFGCQAVGNVHNRAFGVAVQQQVAFAVYHHRAAHLVAPVVVMRNAAQRRFDAAHDDGHIRVGFFAALAVHQATAVWPLAALAAGGVRIVGADFAVRRVTVDHAVHIARGHAVEQIGLAQRLERLGALPIRLGDDADSETLVFQHTANHGHAKAGVVHIRVARDDDDVATVPAQGLHLFAGGGQEFGRTEAGCPVFAVAGKGFGVTRKKRNV